MFDITEKIPQKRRVPWRYPFQSNSPSSVEKFFLIAVINIFCIKRNRFEHFLHSTMRTESNTICLINFTGTKNGET